MWLISLEGAAVLDFSDDDVASSHTLSHTSVLLFVYSVCLTLPVEMRGKDELSFTSYSGAKRSELPEIRCLLCQRQSSSRYSQC